MHKQELDRLAIGLMVVLCAIWGLQQVAIKVAIMDNHVVVCVGNIYATESLFNLGIHPAQPAATPEMGHVA